ncbi:MAG: metal ABC transporter permease [Spirochaetaceae bacterium]|nr:MAG: metal ABC transporter permease [Spirochaetaceae bacterium]
MTIFFQDLLAHAHVLHAVVGAFLASISCGIMGSYLTVRRMTATAGAISHFLLGGLAIAGYLKTVAGWQVGPEAGALVSAVVAALLIWAITIWAKQREDTVLSVIWSVGMAVGGFFIFATPGNTGSLQFYLFGNISLISAQGLLPMGFLALFLVLFFTLFHRTILAIAFDADYAKLRGVRVSLFSFFLLLFASLTVVVVVQLVGIVMAIALLSLPQAVASTFTCRFWQLMVASVLLNILFTVGGFAVSYEPGFPPGATIIIFAGVFYVISLVVKAWRKRRKKQISA